MYGISFTSSKVFYSIISFHSVSQRYLSFSMLCNSQMTAQQRITCSPLCWLFLLLTPRNITGSAVQTLVLTLLHCSTTQQPQLRQSRADIPPGGLPRGWAQEPHCQSHQDEAVGEAEAVLPSTGEERAAQHVPYQRFSPSSASASQSSLIRGLSCTTQLLMTALPDSSDRGIKTGQCRIMQKAICLFLPLNKGHDNFQKVLFQIRLAAGWMIIHE